MSQFTQTPPAGPLRVYVLKHVTHCEAVGPEHAKQGAAQSWQYIVEMVKVGSRQGVQVPVVPVTIVSKRYSFVKQLVHWLARGPVHVPQLEWHNPHSVGDT